MGLHVRGDLRVEHVERVSMSEVLRLCGGELDRAEIERLKTIALAT